MNDSDKREIDQDLRSGFCREKNYLTAFSRHLLRKFSTHFVSISIEPTLRLIFLDDSDKREIAVRNVFHISAKLSCEHSKLSFQHVMLVPALYSRNAAKDLGARDNSRYGEFHQIVKELVLYDDKFHD